MPYQRYVLIIIFSYLIGAASFGKIVAYAKGVNIQKIGSGNPGATNIYRALGPAYGILVFLADMLKGTLAAYLGIRFLGHPAWVVLAGLAAMFGHVFSPFLKFKGGRGAATGLGLVLAISPKIFLVTLVVVVIIIFTTRYVSLASVMGSVLIPILFHVFDMPKEYTVVAVIAGLFVFIRHIPNIKRLRAGTEKKIGGSQND